MGPQEAIVATLASLPLRQIQGKKRLQKLLHLLKLGGADIGVEFRLLHYGAFSVELAQAADLLAVTGHIQERIEPVGVYSTFQSVYNLSKSTQSKIKLSKQFTELLSVLDKYSTVELEVASAIGYLQDSGFSKSDAIKQTKAMKPTKAVGPVLNKAIAILDKVQAVSQQAR